MGLCASPGGGGIGSVAFGILKHQHPCKIHVYRQAAGGALCTVVGKSGGDLTGSGLVNKHTQYYVVRRGRKRLMLAGYGGLDTLLMMVMMMMTMMMTAMRVSGSFVVRVFM